MHSFHTYKALKCNFSQSKI